MMVVAALGRSSRSDLDDFFGFFLASVFPCQQLLGASLDLRQTDTSLWTCCVCVSPVHPDPLPAPPPLLHPPTASTQRLLVYSSFSAG